MIDSTSPLPIPVRVLGVDPGLNRTGYAVLEVGVRGPRLREGGVINSTQKFALAERLRELAPAVMAIEQVFSHVAHPKTAILMAHARGVILLAAAEQRIPVVHYTPRQIKKLLTGSGRATKDQMQHAIQHELRMKKLLEPNDVADASAVALCHFHSVRYNAVVSD
jgi:crossover junction endodeoxyribonuclease RuvC